MNEQNKMDAERAAFEAWYLREIADGQDSLIKYPNGHYINDTTMDAWHGWQARASLPVGVPDGWIACANQLPPIRSVLSEPCMLEGQPVPTLYRSAHVITFDGHHVSSGIVEWFHGKMPVSGVTHWMALPAAPEVNNV